MWGTGVLVLLVFLLGWFQEKKGLKYSVCTASFLMALGAIMRAIPVGDYLFKVLWHFGSFLNGITGIAVMSLPPALSAAWFPPEQRTLATCIAQISTQVGTGLSFMLGPSIVSGKNQSDLEGAKNQTDVDEVKHQVHLYLLIQAGVAFCLFLLTVTFESKPPTP